jgi:C-terminal processing protease CtpA/Prc
LDIILKKDAGVKRIVSKNTPNRKMNGFLDCFEIIWETIHEKYFDPTFGGLDWHEVHDRYQPLITAAHDEKTFYELANKMLFELNVSHVAVLPPEEKDQIDPILCSIGSIGINLRLLEKVLVINAVDQGSPGEMAGLMPGFVIRKINGQTIQQLSNEVRRIPPLNDRNEETQVTINILKQFYRPPGNLINLVFLDENDEEKQAIIQCSQRDGKVLLSEELPACFLQFDSGRLEGDIGWIRFNAFIPPVDELFRAALTDLRDTQALIIDIRGNHGGVWPIRKLLAENLVNEPALFCSYQSRECIQEIFLKPVENPYTGPLAVLVDVLSMSSAEEFAGAMQTIHRGVVVGERTPGICVVCDFLELPNSALLVFPIKQSVTGKGKALEGHGVIPDIKVALDRTQLLQGIDSQLIAAIKHLKNEIKEE